MGTKMAQQVANSGDVALIYVVIAVSAGIIVVLTTLVWFFIRARMSARDRREELLEKRLSSGAEAMQRISQEVVSLQKQLNDYRKEYYETVSKLMEKSEFREYKRDHEKSHEMLNNIMGQITKTGEHQERMIEEVRSDLKTLLQNAHER